MFWGAGSPLLKDGYQSPMRNWIAKRLSKTRVSFRAALSTLLVVMLIGTVAILGSLSYYNLKRNADNLTEQRIATTLDNVTD